MARAKFDSLFRTASIRRSAVIGMVHVQALPGTPQHCLPVPEIVSRAVWEARLYRECGVDGVMVENMHDIPYLRGAVGPEVTACMARVCSEVRQAIGGIPLGVQVLAGANKEALAVAQASSADFIRAEGFVFSHVADEGWMDACAGELLRYRRAVGAENILVFTDIKKKHSSHAVTSDLDVADIAKAAEFFLSDGVILTGQSTGQPADNREIARVKKTTPLPVLVGSGVTVDNLEQYIGADALIVGSHFKEGGQWSNGVVKERVAKFMEKMHSLALPIAD